jgi:hypothetical protein
MDRTISGLMIEHLPDAPRRQDGIMAKLSQLKVLSGVGHLTVRTIFGNSSPTLFFVVTKFKKLYDPIYSAESSNGRFDSDRALLS